jgi:hypothetical protein
MAPPQTCKPLIGKLLGSRAEQIRSGSGRTGKGDPVPLRLGFDLLIPGSIDLAAAVPIVCPSGQPIAVNGGHSRGRRLLVAGQRPGKWSTSIGSGFPS